MYEDHLDTGNGCPVRQDDRDLPVYVRGSGSIRNHDEPGMGSGRKQLCKRAFGFGLPRLLYHGHRGYLLCTGKFYVDYPIENVHDRKSGENKLLVQKVMSQLKKEGFRVKEKDFLATLDEMSEKAFDDQCTGTNPRYPLIEEIKEMYKVCYYGRGEK